MRIGTLVFSRSGSSRLPDKALRHIGGIPLLERVIRRAQLLPWPVFLATTNETADDRLVAVANQLKVESFRGSEERVLERAVLAAEAFGLDAFARLCGDRPLFPLEDLRTAAQVMLGDDSSKPQKPPDLVTTFGDGRCPRGLLTEIVLTDTLRTILNHGVSAEHQEHLTLYFYEHQEGFRIEKLPTPSTSFVCPGFAVDSQSDLVTLDRICTKNPALDLTPAEADHIYAS
jgi:spore coat polysaccharide biosynthesis protein SpsF